MQLPQLQFLNLAQIDRDIQLNKALEEKNALAPYLRRQTEMELEKGGLEMQMYRDKIDRERRIREDLMRLNQGQGGTLQADTAAMERSASYAGPDNPMSPRVAGPNWMQAQSESEPAAQSSGRLSSDNNRSVRSGRMDKLLSQAQVYENNGDFDTAGKIYDHYFKMMPKVKDWQKVDVDGKVMFAPYYEDGTAGNPVPYQVAEKLHFANIGGETIGQNQFTGDIVTRVANTRSPDSLASEGTQRYLHNTPSATAILNSQQGKIPPGYRVSTDGSRLEAIQGGPSDIGKALPGPAAKELAGAGTAVENTRRLTGSFKDDFGGKYVLGDMSNKLGRVFGDDTGQSQWWQDMDTQQNQTRHELFGSALTKTELAAWEKTSVTPNMDAKQIRENLQRRTEVEARAASKLARAYQAAGYNKDQIRELLGSASEYLAAPAPPASPVGGNKKPTATTPANWQGINADYAAGQPGRDSEQLAVLKDELARETDPANRAALMREIDRTQKTQLIADSRAGRPANASAGASQNAFTSPSMPSPAQYKGHFATDQSTGVRYQSNGTNWVRVSK